MEAAVRLFTIRGIPIGIHSSWLIVFGLLTFSLADGILPSVYEGWTATEYWLVGAIASALLFASVVAHELGHAITAQSRGVRVRSITLFIFGGVALLENESETAGDEFWIAVAGPAVSLGLGIACGMLSLPASLVSEHLTAVLQYLASANLILVAFNLVPAYPLDGGRVLRASIWKATGSLDRATEVAATAGMVIGYGFIVFGILIVFGNPISGIWLMAIGWFLRSAAEQASQQLMLRRMFDGVRVASLMRARPITVRPDVTIDSFVSDYVLGHNARGVPVVDDATLAGIVTVSDVKEVPLPEWPERTVATVMTPRERVIVVSPHTGLAEALRLMSERDLHQLPVVDDDTLVGLLTRGDVISFLQLRRELPDVPIARSGWTGQRRAWRAGRETGRHAPRSADR